jgi:molybdopterin-guanine dinucleotide biosynthesis protein B
MRISDKRVFGIAGFKNAGKTTLIVDLIRELSGRELSGRKLVVATIKHAHHEFDIDHPGKDSFLHREAGAVEVIVGSSHRWAHITELGCAPEPSLAELLGHIGVVDLVLIEGYKHGEHPKLEVRRSGQETPLLAGTDPGICVIVSDGPLADVAVPVIRRDDVPAIADFILDQVGL